MIRCLLAIVAAASAYPAAAERVSTTAMTCGQARAFIAARGAAVVGTGGQTYDRFVRDRSFCAATEAAKTSFAPTRDDPRCFVGYRCFEPGRDDWFGDY